MEFELHATSPAVYLNLNVRGLKNSATLAINEKSNELRRQGRQVYKLGLGQSPFPVPDEVRAALECNAHQKDYLPVKGLPALQEAICGYMQRTRGLSFYRPEHVLIGPGSKELMFILQLVYYGDLVIPSPSWVSYAPQARIIGRPLVWLPTRPENGLGVEASDLERLCEQDPERPRLLILNSPGNPTGMMYGDTQLRELAEVARKYRVLLLSDEIYAGLNFGGEHVSVAKYYPEGTIVSTGLSKWCGAGGWRLGAFVVPETLSWLLDAMAAVASETFTSTSAPIQHAAVTAFNGSPGIERWLEKCRRVLAALGKHCAGELRAAGADVLDPQGAFYLFPGFNGLRDRLHARGIHDSLQLCERLLEDTGVATLPGTDFGRPPEDLSLRLAYVDFDGGAALDALDNAHADKAFLQAHCANTLTAVQAMCDWLRAEK
ncbi:MAG TPA: aminotransferase class I/II-fold pyridoxal phosphate-dependent enzyme [Gammaproteobacteria bacterium]